VALVQAETLRLSQSGLFIGSVLYAAPEQLESGGKEIDGRADLHALGVLLYELSTAQHPFADPEIGVVLKRVLADRPRRMSELNPQLSPFFEEVVHTLLEKDREQRFGSAAELRAILDQGEEAPWWRERTRAIRLETRRPLRRIRIPRETALYGRDAELAKLHALYERAKSGEGQVVLLEGEAGIGKTRLVDEFVGLLQQEGEDLNFLFGSYPPGGTATATGAFSTAYREQFGGEGLETTIGRYLSATPLLVPAFAALLRGDAPPPGTELLTKDSLQTVFVHATRALAAERPTVVVIDDLHFAPDEGRALFLALALAVPGHRMFVVGTARPGLPEAWTASVTRNDHASRLDLPRLGANDLARLLTDVFRSERLAEELALQIAAKSDGNPFFVFEIIRELRDGEFVTQEADGTWVRTRNIGEIQIPSSVMDLIRARIAELEKEDRELLDVAACWGFEFDPTLVAAALGMEVLPALRRFGLIERRERLVRSAGRRYVFDHHQVQEALYAGLFEPLRERYHAALATALEARDGAVEKDPKELDGAVAVALCEHFLRGGQGRRALRYLDAALDHLEGGYQNAATVKLADRALRIDGLLRGAERIAVLLRKAMRLHLSALTDEELAALEEALVLSEALGDPRAQLPIRVRIGWNLTLTGHHERAREALTDTLELARAAADRVHEGRASGVLGLLLMDLGRYEEALPHHERHLAISLETGDRIEESRAIGNLGNVLSQLDRHQEARLQIERQLALARQLGQRHSEAKATSNLGVAAFRVGNRTEAKELYERGLALYREVGDRRAEATTTGNLGAVHYEMGQYEEARAYYERHLRISRGTGFLHGEAVAAGNLGGALFSLGRCAEAMQLFEQKLAIARKIGHRLWEGRLQGDFGTLYMALGDIARARGALETSRILCVETRQRQEEGDAILQLGAVEEQEGNLSDAERLYRETLVLVQGTGDQRAASWALVSLGRVLVRQGRIEEARPHLEQALALARELDIPDSIVLSAGLALLPGEDPATALDVFAAYEPRLKHAAKMEGRFLLWKATGDRSHLEVAHQLLVHLRDHAPPEYRATMIVNVPLHRDIQAAWEAEAR